MKTGPLFAALLARPVSWLNSRLDKVVIGMAGFPRRRNLRERYDNLTECAVAALAGANKVVCSGGPAHDVSSKEPATRIFTTKRTKSARRTRAAGALCASLVCFVVNNFNSLASQGISA
jgi:hypothetical protein